MDGDGLVQYDSLVNKEKCTGQPMKVLLLLGERIHIHVAFIEIKDSKLTGVSDTMGSYQCTKRIVSFNHLCTELCEHNLQTLENMGPFGGDSILDGRKKSSMPHTLLLHTCTLKDQALSPLTNNNHHPLPQC